MISLRDAGDNVCSLGLLCRVLSRCLTTVPRARSFGANEWSGRPHLALIVITLNATSAIPGASAAEDGQSSQAHVLGLSFIEVVEVECAGCGV